MDSHLNRSYLTSAYLPPVDYFRVIAKSEKIIIEGCENYQKQSYRSRCLIYCANGLMPLIIPVLRDHDHSVRISEIKIDYSKEWQKQHWRAIVSAYKSSPFFDYYQDDIIPFYLCKEDLLFDFNFKLLKTLLDLIGVDTQLDVTKDYSPSYQQDDYRELIHPKRQPVFNINENGRYRQVFAHKHGFIPNLSIIDLLFNEGPNAISFL
ncbi:MAG: WbqC family protein [Bacteroidales bacterium]